jgi:phosphatidylglycerol:prolipoprotein diacylglycerol transferase
LANAVSGTPLGLKIEPTQLIEAAAEFCNFLLLTWLLGRKKFDGQVWASFMILYGIERYFIEFLRDDPGRGEVFGGLMTGTQLISILLVVGGGLIWWLKSSTPHSALNTQKSGSAL